MSEPSEVERLALEAEIDRELSLAGAMYRSRQQEQAIEKCRELLALHPLYIPLLETLADWLGEAGNAQEAHQLLQQAHQEDPGNRRIEEKLGLALLRLKDQEQLEALLSEPPKPLSPEMAAQRGKAMLWSVVLPGTAHMFFLGEEQRVKGLALFSGYVVAWLIVMGILINNSHLLGAIIAVLGVPSEPGSLGLGGAFMGIGLAQQFLLIIGLLAIVVLWFYAVRDTYRYFA